MKVVFDQKHISLGCLYWGKHEKSNTGYIYVVLTPKAWRLSASRYVYTNGYSIHLRVGPVGFNWDRRYAVKSSCHATGFHL
jgi:hypothetical protein